TSSTLMCGQSSLRCAPTLGLKTYRGASVSRLESADVRSGEKSTRSDDIVNFSAFQVRIACGPQELLEHLRADLTTYHKAVPARAAEVNPGVDARVGGFLRRLREALKRTRDARIRLSARYGEADLVGPEKAGQYLGPGGAQDGVER